MNAHNYPIFRKDFGLLIKMAVGALAMQAAIMFFYPSIALTIGVPSKTMDDWFPQVQQAIGVLVGLIAAGYWYAEERAGNNLVFLSRLPVSANRIWNEKTAAALAVFGILFLIQIVWSMLAYANYKSVKEFNVVLFILSLLGVSLFAYCVGLPLSRYLKQTISVVLLGLIAVVVFGYFFLIAGSAINGMIRKYLNAQGVELFSSAKQLSGYFVSFLILMALVCVFIGYAIVRVRGKRKSSTHFDFLSTAYYMQNRLYIYLACGVLLFVIFRFLSPDFLFPEPLRSSILLICVVFSSAIGVGTYTHEEKHGLRNLLYYHPVSLGHVYWVRWICGLCIAMVPAFCLMVFYFFADPRNLVSEFHKPASSQIFPLFPLLNVSLLGLVPYTCAAFVTHATRNTLHALFESLIAVGMVLSLYVFLYSTPELGYQGINMTHIVLSYQPVNFSHFYGLTPILLVGFSIAGWRAATDRELVTRNTLYRQVYVGRIFLFVLVLSVIVLRTGWKDLFFLATGFDIGQG